ncbi:MAG: Malonyl CoA-acyl carrier protein transacylase [Phycisphaerae bacterium]|nr:Malonyl CoA-acyl carrier protein transacylase [Phycisphaerae bacterium]
MGNNAAIFPGQGAQFVGMGKDLVAASGTAAHGTSGGTAAHGTSGGTAAPGTSGGTAAPGCDVAAETFARADEILGFSLSTLCFDGPAERLNATDIQQPAIFVTSVALYRAAQQRGKISDAAFSVMAGLSLGEYTALHLAGAVSFDDALRLVYRRGTLMQQAAERTPGGMASIIGLDEPQVLALCESVAKHGRVAPANYNGPGQIVISGDSAACDAAVAAAEQFGGKAVPLKVAGAFHSELMRPAADGLRPHLEACAFLPPKTPVIANLDAQYHGDAAAIRASLYRQVFNPVRWHACMQRLIADGMQTATEIGPGRVLAGLMRKIDRNVKVANIGGAGDL